MRASLSLAFVLLLVGCNTFGDVEPYTGPTDSGNPDAGTSDVGQIDSGSDAGPTDASNDASTDAATDMGTDASGPTIDLELAGYQTLSTWSSQREEVEHADMRVAVNHTGTDPYWVTLAMRVGSGLAPRGSLILTFDLGSRPDGGYLGPFGDKSADTVRGLQQEIPENDLDDLGISVKSHDIMRAPNGELFHAAIGEYRNNCPVSGGGFPFAGRMRLDPLTLNIATQRGFETAKSPDCVVRNFGDAQLFLSPGGEVRLAATFDSDSGDTLPVTFAVDTASPFPVGDYATAGPMVAGDRTIRGADGGLIYPIGSNQFELWAGILDVDNALDTAGAVTRHTVDLSGVDNDSIQLMSSTSANPVLLARGDTNNSDLVLQPIPCSFETEQSAVSGLLRVSTDGKSCNELPSKTTVPLPNSIRALAGGGTARDYFVVTAEETLPGDVATLRTFDTTTMVGSPVANLPLETGRRVQHFDLDVVEFSGRTLLGIVSISTPIGSPDDLRYDLWVFYLQPDP